MSQSLEDYLQGYNSKRSNVDSYLTNNNYSLNTVSGLSTKQSNLLATIPGDTPTVTSPLSGKSAEVKSVTGYPNVNGNNDTAPTPKYGQADGNSAILPVVVIGLLAILILK